MEASISRLRDLLSLDLGGEARSETQDPQEILNGLAGLPAPVALEKLRGQYFLAVSNERNPYQRFRLLEDAQPEIQVCLPMVEKMVSEAILPLPAKIGVVALEADNCLKGLSNGYSSIAAHICHRQLDPELAELLRQSAYRAMEALLRRQILAYRAYAIPSDASWHHMHDLYRITRTHGLANVGGEASVERLYLTALLTAYADPGKVPRHNLEALQQAVDSLVPFAGIVDAREFDPNHAALIGRFLVSTDAGGPGRPLAKAGIVSSMSGNYIIECRGVINALDRKLAQGLDAEHHIPQNVLSALRTAMNGQWSRRFARMRFKPRASLVAGMGNAIGLILALNSATPLDEAMTGASDWAVLNESPDGFGIRYLGGPRWQAQAGDVVVLRMPEENRLHICLIRRIANRKPNKFDLGLQELSPCATVIQIPGEGGGPARQAIFLPHLPAFDGSAGVLARSGSFRPETVLRTSGEDGKAHLWQRGNHSENNGQVEFHVLSPAQNLT